METRKRHLGTCPLLSLPHFSPRGPEGSRKKKQQQQKLPKPFHWNQSKWRRREGSNIRQGSAQSRTRFSETSSDNDDTAGEGPGRGPQTASPQVSVHSRPLDPRPLPAWARGAGWGGLGRLPGDGASNRRVWGRTGAWALSTFRPSLLEGTPGPQLQSPPSRTHPAAPPALPRGRPQVSP